MCTVSVIPLNSSDFILTSNRDESPNRKAIAPQFYKHNNATLFYPKDKVKNGTWIGVSSKNRVLCLLNGGFITHERVLPYEKSRGLIVKDLLAVNNIQESLKEYDFSTIEPFTLIVIDWNDEFLFLEFVWDGKTSHYKVLDQEPIIWSSSTLYSPQMKEERQKWFNDFVTHKELTEQSLLNFHQNTQIQNKHYGVIIDRENVKTTSITQIIKNGNCIVMYYIDVLTNKMSTQVFNFLDSVYD